MCERMVAGRWPRGRRALPGMDPVPLGQPDHAWVERRIKYSGAGLFAGQGQAPKFENSGSGVPWRKFWIGYHARSTTAILSGFLSFQPGGKSLPARRPQKIYSLFHPPVGRVQKNAARKRFRAAFSWTPL